MKVSIKKSLQGLLLVPALALGVSAVVPTVVSEQAFAQEPRAEIERGVVAAGGGANSSGQTFMDLIKTVVNTLLFIIGAVAVIMIIYGGFKYVTSAGDSSGVTSAKNTILYAVIGLVVAMLSYAIVGFVLSRFE